MKVLNVIEISEGILGDITSFGMNNGANKDVITKKAEKLFVEKAVALGMDDSIDDIEILLENGYFYCPDANASVCLSLSEV